MMLAVTFRERLMQEFAARRAVNTRYSLRAFANLLGADHATLSQILRGKRQVPVERIGSWARKLKLSPEETAVYAAVARIADEQARAASEALRQWAAEMMALLGDAVHRELLRLMRTKGFKSDSRSAAQAIGVGVDDVNIALSRMLRLGLMEVGADGVWRDKTGLSPITAQSFRKYVAERVKSPLAEHGG
jgi:transcriptional regulator with XRE-family HTH domain